MLQIVKIKGAIKKAPECVQQRGIVGQRPKEEASTGGERGTLWRPLKNRIEASELQLSMNIWRWDGNSSLKHPPVRGQRVLSQHCTPENGGKTSGTTPCASLQYNLSLRLIRIKLIINSISIMR